MNPERRQFSAALLGAGVGAATFGLAAPAAAQGGPVEGTHYVRLAQPLPAPGGGKIEVVEFFSYACPHCNAFEPTLEAWIKKLPPDVNFRRAPVPFLQNAENFQKLYFALEAMGLRRHDAAQGVLRDPRRARSAWTSRRTSPPSSPSRAWTAPSSSTSSTRSRSRARSGRPASWPRPTRSTACRRSACRAATTLRCRSPAARTGHWPVTDFLVQRARKGA